MFLIKMHHYTRFQIDIKTSNENPEPQIVYQIQLSTKVVFLQNFLKKATFLKRNINSTEIY